MENRYQFRWKSIIYGLVSQRGVNMRDIEPG